MDSVPLGHGGVINDSLPAVKGEVPLPEWSDFEEEDLVDLAVIACEFSAEVLRGLIADGVADTS